MRIDINIGYLLRGSSEENEMAHKELKAIYDCTSKHLDTLGQQLLPSWNVPSLASISLLDDIVEDDDIDVFSIFSIHSSVLLQDFSDSKALVDSRSGTQAHDHICPSIILQKREIRSIWIILKF